MKIGGQDVQSFPFTTVEGTDQAFNMIYMATCTETGTSGSTEVLQIQMGLRSNDIAQTWPFFIDGTGISINTTIANDINFYAQYSVASVHNTVTLLAWSVELMYPPPGNVIT
jgi:hypothetical protein